MQLYHFFVKVSIYKHDYYIYRYLKDRLLDTFQSKWHICNAILIGIIQFCFTELQLFLEISNDLVWYFLTVFSFQLYMKPIISTMFCFNKKLLYFLYYSFIIFSNIYTCLSIIGTPDTKKNDTIISNGQFTR